MRKMLVTLALLAAPRAALACPVCFGESDSPLALGANMGILAMLVVTVGVLIGFASFFIYLIRRARLVDDARPVEPGDYLHDVQERTA
jgi:hypothetical protein